MKCTKKLVPVNGNLNALSPSLAVIKKKIYISSNKEPNRQFWRCFCLKMRIKPIKKLVIGDFVGIVINRQTRNRYIFMADDLQFSIPTQHDWQKLFLPDIKRPEILNTSFKIPTDFNASAQKLRNRLNAELPQCDNLIHLANLIIPCAKMQYLHNHFSTVGHISEPVYDDITANKMIVLLYDIASRDLNRHPIQQYMDLHLYQGPVLSLGDYGSAVADPKKYTFYIVNNHVKTVPVFNGNVNPAIKQSVQVLDYIMYNSLTELYKTHPQGYVDGIIFQNICRDSFNYPEMQQIFNNRKQYAINHQPRFNNSGYGKLMDWHLDKINQYLQIGVTLVAKTGER